MNRRLLLASSAVLALGLAACDKKAAPTTAPAPAAAGTPAASVTEAKPTIGIRPVSKEQYKPVDGKMGGRIIRDSLGEPKSFNPVTAAETSTTEYTARMFEGLTRTDAFTGDAAPLIAEKWEAAADGVTWTFHLRRDVVFNDGKPLTAKDVAFTWNELVFDSNRPAGKEPRWPSGSRDIATIDGKPIVVAAVDDYTVKVVTPVKIAILPQMMAEGILPEHVYGKLARDGTFGGAISTDSKPEQIVGSGPFILGEYRRGQSVTLKRNPHYWQKDSAGQSLPYFAEEIFQITRDMNTMLLNFERRITDTYAIRSGGDVARLKPKEQADHFKLYQFGPDNGTLFMAFNMNLDAAKAGKLPAYKVDWFRDRRFRQAVSYAIDRDAQIKNIYRNLAYAQAAPFTLAAGPLKQEGFAPRPCEPEKAKALLAEMGFKAGRDGVLVDGDGHRLSLTLVTNAGNNQREEQCDFIRKDLQKVGIEVNTQFLEFNLLVDKLDVNFDWELMIMGFTGNQEPHFGANFWKSSGTNHIWWPEQKTPSFPWEKRIDEIFTAGIQELDSTKRKTLYREWVQIAYDEQPVVYLTVREQLAALRDRFGNVFPAEVGDLFHNEQQMFQLSEK